MWCSIDPDHVFNASAFGMHAKNINGHMA